MKKIAKFEKVSYEQFKNDWRDSLGDMDEIGYETIYSLLKMPKRATKGSAGYDFFAPTNIYLKPGQTLKVPTGMRAQMIDGWVLQCYPRSGLGFKYRLQLDNTVGIIDSDYYFSSNEGHIMLKITNDTTEYKELKIKRGEGFAQGIFLQYGITVDDDTTEVRDGGFGSTTKEGK